MKGLPLLCVLCAGLLLGACGGSSPTTGMSFEEFQKKLQAMRKPHKRPCEDCGGEGTVADPATGARGPCPACGGKGTIEGFRGATLAEFEAAFGAKLKEENKPGDLIWSYWFFRCRDGLVRLPAYESEEKGDEIRVVTGKPELVK